ncbi:DUF5134 domain-containing protein [Amycolatopsis sp. NBC_00355]|uniref:DUF5134 domain-containing protein n=1 Tax=Amycolatopsis sp. NBC_00355 TaxID=2975957 RepID=UPI002E276C47
MTGSFALRVALGVGFLLLAAYYAGRWVLSRRDGPAAGWGAGPAHASHLVLCAGMAVMVQPAMDPLPAPVWIALFAGVTGWFAVRILRRRAPAGELHHVVGGAAMLYMVVAMPGLPPMFGIPPAHDMAGMDMAGMDMAGMHEMTTMPGMTTAAGAGTGLAVPIIAWVLAGYFAAHTVRLGARLVVAPAVAVAEGPAQRNRSPRLLGACRILTSVGMGGLLLAMAGWS